MTERIRVLHVEDNSDHALLIRRSLEREDPALEMIEASSAEEALQLLEKESIDVILSDYALGPGMNGLDLLKAVREIDARLPFVLLTGQGNEEVASTALRMGANDYIIKRSGTLQFRRLALTLRNQWEARSAQRGKEQAESRYRHLVENVNAGIGLARDDRFVYVNPKLCEMTGYSAEELTSRPFADFITPASRNVIVERYERRREWRRTPDVYDVWVWHKEGGEICLELTASLIQDYEGLSTLAVMRDVTEDRRTEERARSYEERFRMILEQANEAIFLCELDGSILDANPAASRLSGYSLDELRSMHVQDLHTPSERYISEMELQKVRRGDFHGFTALGKCKDGSEKHCVVTGSTIEMEGRQLLLGLVMEIPDPSHVSDLEETERRIAAEAGARFKAAIEQAPLIAVQGYDREGKVTYWNRASEELYGFNSTETLGKTLEELILDEGEASDFRETLHKVWEEAQPSPAQEWLTHDRWGKRRWVYSTMFPVVEEGRCSEVFCMDLDITSRKQLEAELRERNADLEAFAHTVSHDLRVPLTSLDGFAHLAREASEGKMAPEETAYLDRIIRIAGNMERLIASMLEFARSGQGVQSSETVDLEQLMQDVWMERQAEVERTGAALGTSFASPEVITDAVLLKQVLANLLDNALKFHDRSRAIEVEAGSNAGHGEVVLYVKDNGPGIPEEERDAVFEPFKRLSPSSAGLGIGLSTVKRAVESWGGRIWVESSPGGGSTFFFTIPMP